MSLVFIYRQNKRVSYGYSLIRWTFFLILFQTTIPSSKLSAQTEKVVLSKSNEWIKEGNYIEALNCIDGFLKVNKDSPKVLAKRSLIFLEMDSLDNAFRDIYQALDYNRTNDNFIQQLIWVAERLNNWDTIHYLMNEKILVIDKEKRNWIRANYQLLHQDYNGALTILNSIDYEAEKPWKVLTLKAKCYDGLGAYPSSQSCYLRAISLLEKSEVIADNRYFLPRILYYTASSFYKSGKLWDAKHLLSKCYTVDSVFNNSSLLPFYIAIGLKDTVSASRCLERIIRLNPLNPLFRLEQGKLFYFSGKMDDAISSTTMGISLGAGYEAFLLRGLALRHKMKFEESRRDILKANELNSVVNADSLLRLIFAEEYEYNRESVSPLVRFLVPSDCDSTYCIPVMNIYSDFILETTIYDKSEIGRILIDQENIFFDNGRADDSIFRIPVTPILEHPYTLNVCDVYSNCTQVKFKLVRGENHPPELRVNASIPFFSNTFIFDTLSKDSLHINFAFSDEHSFKLFSINDSLVDNKLSDKAFSLNLISWKDFKNNKLKIAVTDQLGNDTLYEFSVLKEGASKTPMGRTWLVMIENSDYSTLNPLSGPGLDFMRLKLLIKDFEIHHFIHLKNATKEQMDRFFSISLREQLKLGQVKSLIVWYSGHGIFLNDVGYWIPVDGVLNDEYSYYSISNLKSSLMTYNALKHILVVSDACQTGPSFYRESPWLSNLRCDNLLLTSSKSAQVLTSSDFENSADNGMFSKIFCAYLEFSKENCIPIDKVAEHISVVINSELNQSPRFGRIKNLEDELGTFFFIRRKKN